MVLNTKALLAMHNLDLTHLKPNCVKLTNDDIMKLNAQTFLLRVSGFRPYVDEHKGKAVIRLGSANIGNKAALLRHLRLKESRRWHPDTENRRTGMKNVIDEKLGRLALIVAVRTAVQELIGMLE